MSPSEQPPASSQQQQKSISKRENPPFADWPTIKILSPPQGQFSQKSDEWCLTYCSQSVTGRIHSKEPNCRSICLRKVFPHEVQNIVSFKKHKSVGPDGKAKYPLPKEGQPNNLPRLLGGTSNSDSEEDSPKPSRTNYWDEGWYLWAGQSKWFGYRKTDFMKLDLQKQEQVEVRMERRREIWHDYQERLKRGGVSGVVYQQPKKNGPIEPFPNFPSLLVPFPPDFPIFEKIHKFLQPTYRVLNITYKSIASGEQKQFALLLWEKAKPVDLAFWIFAYSCQQWKNWNDGKKDS